MPRKTTKKQTAEQTVMYVRVKSTFEDIMGYVKRDKNKITITNPMAVSIETTLEESRQFISLNEYIPQAIVQLKSVTFNNDEIMFAEPVTEKAAEVYKQISEVFYNEEKKKQKMEEYGKNVVSMLDALANKKDKPVH